MKNSLNNATEIVFIIDKSGSMEGLEDDTIGGFNSMLGKQKKLDYKAFLTTVLFSNEVTLLHDREDIHDVKPLTNKEYYVGGSTSLLDAIGLTIQHIDNIHRYINKEDIPGHTLVIITTDGYENSSHKYTYKMIHKIINEHKAKGWEFLFLGANIDAKQVASDLGIRKDKSVTYKSNRKGTRLNYDTLCTAINDYRITGCVDAEWSKPIEDF